MAKALRTAAERRAIAAGRAVFGAGWRPDRRAMAPGRIELLGNHLDYNGGPVLCAAIDRWVVALANSSPLVAGGVAMVAADIPVDNMVRLDPPALREWRNPEGAPGTFDYLRGSIAATEGRSDVTLRTPTAIAAAGDVPLGVGLSSSAALCVALALALVKPRPPDRELVLMAQEAENRAGSPCGTMDQSASVAGGVIRFDAATLSVRRLSPDLGDRVFVVADSGVVRSLGASSYPCRVEEARAALEHTRRVLGRDIPNLAALAPSDLARLASGPDPLPEPLLARVRHIVRETARVERGEAALRAGDWTEFGRLMIASGRSSATDYAISHPRVEALASEALEVDGVLGARMMGGGEGGSVLILLPRSRVPALECRLRDGYYRDHGMADRTGLLHVCAFASGAVVEPLDPGLR